MDIYILTQQMQVGFLQNLISGTYWLLSQLNQYRLFKEYYFYAHTPQPTSFSLFLLILIVDCLEQILSGLYCNYLVMTRHYFSSNQFSTIYKSHIRSQMEYYSPLWDGAGRVVLGRLDRLQNRAVRLIRGSQTIRRNVVSLSLCTDIFMVVAHGSFMIWFRLRCHQGTDRCTPVFQS